MDRTAMNAGGLTDKAQAGREFRASSKVVVAFAAALFASFTALYLLDAGAYLELMRYWMPYRLTVPFADAAYIEAQLQCWRAGVDVYATNACDMYGRVQAYSPLWLRLWWLPASRDFIAPFGLAIVAGFIASLAVLPKIQRKSDIALLLLAVASPVVGYGVERANVDLIMFALAALTILCLERSPPARAMGYALIMVAALLKLYPAVLLILVVRERPRVAIGLMLGALIVSDAFTMGWQGELIRMMHNVPQPKFNEEGLGGRRLADGIAVLLRDGVGLLNGGATAGTDNLDAPRGAILGILAQLTLGVAMLSRSLVRSGALPDAFETLTRREQLCFVTGAALFCGCFITGNSNIYREALLLFTLPALFRFRHMTSLPWSVRMTGWLTIGLMYTMLPVLLVEAASGRMTEAVLPFPTFSFWLCREVLWWWVFTVMVSGLACFARQAWREMTATTGLAAAHAV